MQGTNYPEIRDAIARLCADFPGEYWRKLDRDMAYPAEFVQALTDGGWLSVLIPEEFGGAGLPLGAAAAILEEIHRSGGNGGACHAQIYTMGTLMSAVTLMQVGRLADRFKVKTLALATIALFIVMCLD